MTGYAFGLSDVRVTFADKNEKDCLQDINPVGQYLAAAFAGSVQIGFRMIESLCQYLHFHKTLQRENR